MFNVNVDTIDAKNCKTTTMKLNMINWQNHRKVIQLPKFPKLYSRVPA